MRRPDLGDDTVAVGDQHGLAAGGKPHVFAELVLEQLEPDSAQMEEVAPVDTLSRNHGGKADCRSPAAHAISGQRR